MTQNSTPDAKQDQDRTLQESGPEQQQAIQALPKFPNWPTSIPGPRVTPPPPGMRAANAMRSEQVAEVGYNQESGEPGSQSPLRSLPDESMKGRTSFDQQETAQDVLKKRKERL